MLDEAHRQRIMLQQEGAILAMVGSCDKITTCEVARCQIDGITNALIRMEGAEETAHFVFALSDRVSGGLRDVTDYLPPFLVGEERIEEHAPIVRQNRVPDFAYGFLCGLAAMATFTMLAMGRL